MDYRCKQELKVIRFPKGLEEEDRGLKGGCCCETLVLASTTDTDPAINDIKGVYIKKTDPADVVSFQIEKCGVGVLPNLGVVKTFPQDTDVIGFEYDWRQYLSAHGPGKYKISKVYTMSGVSGAALEGVFTLKPYSIQNARGTVRILSVFNSYFLPEEVDFTGSGYRDSIRFKGFFGFRKPGTEVRELIDKGLVSVKTTRQNLNVYELLTDPVLECITSRLLDFFFLNDDETYVTDHNASNHSYQYFDKPLVIEEEPDVNYIKRSRLATVNVVYSDRKKNKKSFYNKKI